MSSSASRAWISSGRPVSRAAAMWRRKPSACASGVMLVVVVEARLADGDHLRMRGQAHDLLERDVELLVRVVRMRADRAVDVGVRLRDGEQLRRSGGCASRW